MRINWFSPLPPARTGIALYTSSLVATFAKRVDLTLWTDQETWDADLEKRVRVRRFSPQRFPWRELNTAELTFYNIGNSRPFHQGIWEISQSHSGVVVLHDLCLQHFFADLYLNHWKDLESYRSHMERYYGEEGVHAVTRYREGAYSTEEFAQLYPLTPLALENAAGALVHTRRGLEILAGMGLVPAAYAPLPYAPHTDLAGGAAARTPGPPYRLIAFGLMGPNRRLNALLEAWAGLSEKELLRLDICGDLLDVGCTSRMRSLGLESLVSIHGYVPAEVLDEKLARAHLAINLRYPTMGEASLTQLLIWEHALPSLVTQTGWYESCPPDVVAFVRPDREIADLRSHLAALVRFPERFAAMGQRGRRLLLEQHSPERYVESLLRFGAEVQKFQMRPLRLRLAERAATEMKRWVAPGASEILAEKVGSEICALSADPGAEDTAT